MKTKSHSLVLCAVSCIATFVLLVGVVFAWFASGTPEAALSLNAVGSVVDVYITDDGGLNWQSYDGIELTCSFTNFFCGSANSRTISLKLVNTSQQEVGISLCFRAPGGNLGQEIPYFDAVCGMYHYLGSQLQISGVKAWFESAVMDVSSAAVGEGSYLVPTSSLGVEDGQVTGVPEEISVIPQLVLVDDLQLSPGETILQLGFTFVDNGQNQSIYQEFLGKCSRRLTFSVE